MRELLERHGVEARRSLGQNFVVDPNTVRRIARLAAVGPGDSVVEVGPGLGSLTLALADTGAEVLAVEKDRSLLPLLDDVLHRSTTSLPVPAGAPTGRVRVVEGDALTVDWSALLGERSWSLVANLPYNVAVPVLLRVLADAPQVRRLIAMVQLEVAERICAPPGTRTIGIPTIKVAWYGTAEIVAKVGPEVFLPKPRVSSAVLAVERCAAPSDLVGPAEVFPLVEQAYRQRRKMLRSTLGGVLRAAVFDDAGIDPRSRPEQLDLDDWVRLAEVAVSGVHPPPAAPPNGPVR